ncbi:MAG: nucleotidyltransferase family protein [Candidatus Manganitrophus sp. SB1]|nr:nucleotidyltransferase family protein [Candidatus Manganitrophus morganii]
MKNRMSKRAIILAGGKGTRLRPYTVVLPKPLMPIGDYPILEVIVRQLARQGFDHITLAVNHQAELIKAFFGDGTKWNVLIDYSLESQPLGTMGPLRLISDLPKHFLVMNGDILTDLDFGAFYEQHIKDNRLFTISAHRREQLIDYGVLETDGHEILRGFCEKPKTSYEVSMGIYMLSREVLRFIPDSIPYGFDRLMLDLLAQKHGIAVKTYGGYWMDIGRPDDYMQAIEQFECLKGKFIDG